MDIIKENIKDLTSLWQKVSEQANAYTTGEDFDFGEISYSAWPNKLWFHHDVNKRTLDSAKSLLLSHSTRLTIPYWDIYQSTAYELLEANGFEKLSEQVGMYLKLTRTYEKADELELKKVTDDKDALLWSQLFEKAFNYHISHKLLFPVHPDIDYLIAWQKNEPVGTALVHVNENGVAGIHAMGVIPEMRRKGFAEQMMTNILYEITEQGFNYATLQASTLGQGLYLKLGFKEQFIMKNYALRQEV
ncbi:GNAT family N-acetyltransferase [Fulvivirga sp. M361]|uniref:GNAT family N-acetyltransferase n=1 Tax=Fulvivirga sp. M361 TaxID=2594266 RepID=UPI00117B7BEC|nr:GNAT family N-acetyltransferase [Fulvivirga sp. M361]TRX59999.1 GNAT family N-acetyltransferase [Fulvivirga sp. M361]